MTGAGCSSPTPDASDATGAHVLPVGSSTAAPMARRASSVVEDEATRMNRALAWLRGAASGSEVRSTTTIALVIVGSASPTESDGDTVPAHATDVGANRNNGHTRKRITTSLR